MDEDAMVADNFQVFKHLQMHPIWGHFFQTTRDGKLIEELVVGEKFAEGGQAEIYHVQVKWGGESGLNAFIERYVWEFELKVFKKGTLLGHLQAQWPHGLLLNHKENLESINDGILPEIMNFSDVFHGVLLGDGRFAFLMRKEKGDLRSYIDRHCVLTTSQERGGLEKGEAEVIMHEIAHGMDWLHGWNIVHRDLKSSNVLLQYDRDSNEVMACYVADYECSVGVVGTGFFKAPEILQVCKDGNVSSRPDVFTKAADVYSYGMTCYEILTGKLPFEGHSYSDYDLVLEGQRPELPTYVDDWMRELLNSCWQSNPEARPTFTEILYVFEANSALARESGLHNVVTTASFRTEIVRGNICYEYVNSARGSDTLRAYRHYALVLDGHSLVLPADVAFGVFGCIDLCLNEGIAIPTLGFLIEMLPRNSEISKILLDSVFSH